MTRQRIIFYILYVCICITYVHAYTEYTYLLNLQSLSIYLSIYLFIYLSIYRSIDPNNPAASQRENASTNVVRSIRFRVPLDRRSRYNISCTIRLELYSLDQYQTPLTAILYESIKFRSRDKSTIDAFERAITREK